MTKQGLGELVRHLAAPGYVDVGVDPQDRRARRVRLTRRGWRAIRTGERVIDAFDGWLEDTIGEQRVSQLRETLVLIAEPHPEPDGG